jgi:flagellar hook-length control protein FliK
MSKEKAADYFSRHLSSNECHITSDGRVFHTKGTADGFANGLKDNTVASYTRAEVEAIKVKSPKVEAPKTKVLKVETPADQTQKDDAPKVFTLEDLQAFDAETATYEEAKVLVKGLAIETPSQSKTDLFTAIEAQKAIINTEVQE